jgi:RNA polymerase sigma factor (sigma-70 family)
MGKKKNDPYSHFDVNEANYLSVEESNELEQSEIEHQINTALSQLGERDRMLLKMKYFEDRSGREIAHSLNLPENNIPCYTMRARNQLKRVILKMAS